MTSEHRSWGEEVRGLLPRVALERLLAADGRVVEKRGALLWTCCPFHQERTPSCVIYEDDQHYHCHGCGAHGDAVTYLRQIRGLSAAEALDVLRREAGEHAVARKVDRRRKHHPVMPVPAVAERIPRRFSIHGLGEPTATWEYLGQTGALLGVVARYQYQRDGEAKKSIRAWFWCRSDDGTEGWVPTRPSSHLPLYGLDQLAARPDATVLLVEGEKSAAAAQGLGGFVAMTWMGGAAAITAEGRHDWQPLAGRKVVLWPDWDKPGVVAMWEARGHIEAAGGQVVGVVDLRGVMTDANRGHDVADDDAATRAERLTHINPDVVGALRHLVGVTPATVVAIDPENANAAKAAERDASQLARRIAAMQGDAPVAPAGGDEPPEPPEDGSAETEQPEPQHADLRGDIANAQEFVRDWTNKLLHCHNAPGSAGEGMWFRWTGTHWQGSRNGQEREAGKQTARRLASAYLRDARAADQEAEDLRAANFAGSSREAKAEKDEQLEILDKRAKALRRQADTISGLTRVEAMIRMAQSDPAISIDYDDFDPHWYFINTPQCTIDCRDGTLLKHSPSHRCTQITAAPYRPDEPIGRWRQVKDNLFQKNANLERLMQDALAQGVMGHNRLERFFVLLGPGRSGKGTLMEAYKAMLGNYCATAEFTTFTRGQKNVRDDIYRLRGARVVLCSETNPGEQWDVGILKMYVGNDTITARALFGVHEEFRSCASLFFQINSGQVPKLSETDDALYDRMMIIPTGPTVPDDKRDPDLKEWAMDPERGGAALLAWVVRGAIRTANLKRYDEPPEVIAAKASYRGDQDRLATWLDECVRVCDPANAGQHDSTLATTADIQRSYLRFCDGRGLSRGERLVASTLVERLEALGCRRAGRRVNGRYTKVWLGISLAEGTPPEEDAMHAMGHERHIPTWEDHNAYVQRMKPGMRTQTETARNRVKPHSGFTKETAIQQGSDGAAGGETATGPNSPHAGAGAGAQAGAHTHMRGACADSGFTVSDTLYADNNNIKNNKNIDIDLANLPEDDSHGH